MQSLTQYSHYKKEGSTRLVQIDTGVYILSAKQFHPHSGKAAEPIRHTLTREQITSLVAKGQAELDALKELAADMDTLAEGREIK